jgi:hypothetical protein
MFVLQRTRRRQLGGLVRRRVKGLRIAARRAFGVSGRPEADVLAGAHPCNLARSPGPAA